MRNILLTGIPRCGTTLAAALIDGMPDAVALNEPEWQVVKVEGFAKWLAEDFARVRQALFSGEPVPDRRGEGGAVLTNYYRTDAQTGKMEQTYKTVPFTRPGLTQDFTLAMKHNGLYLATLPQLAESKDFTVIAIIRHPVEAIHSWRSLDLPISRGTLPAALPYWPEMAALVQAKTDLLEKQVRMYDLICARLYQLRERIHILPYETMIEQPGQLLAYAGLSGELPRGLIRTPSRRVPEGDREMISEALAAHGEHFRYFYKTV